MNKDNKDEVYGDIIFCITGDSFAADDLSLLDKKVVDTADLIMGLTTEECIAARIDELERLRPYFTETGNVNVEIEDGSTVSLDERIKQLKTQLAMLKNQ